MMYLINPYLSQHGLPGAGRPHHEDTLPGPPDALEEVRHPHGQHHRLLQQPLRLLQVRNVVPVDVGIF